MTDEALLLRLLAHNLRPRERDAFDSMLRGLARFGHMTEKQRQWAESRLAELEPPSLADLPPSQPVEDGLRQEDVEAFAGDSSDGDLREALRLPEADDES